VWRNPNWGVCPLGAQVRTTLGHFESAAFVHEDQRMNFFQGLFLMRASSRILSRRRRSIVSGSSLVLMFMRDEYVTYLCESQ